MPKGYILTHIYYFKDLSWIVFFSPPLTQPSSLRWLIMSLRNETGRMRNISECPIKNKRRKSMFIAVNHEYELYEFPVESKENTMI